MFTVILPAAGEGSRLGLPYPKEIHHVLPDISLVDFSLAHIRSASDLVSQVVTVITPRKESVADYIAEALESRPPTEHAYFNDSYTEWPGSIRSAEQHFGEYNVVLLPDSVLEPAGSTLLMESYAAAFESGADVVFAYLAETEPERLTNLGALTVSGSQVTAFCDKPNDPESGGYNAFWGSFGFRGEVGPDLLDLMMRSVAREPVDLASLGATVAAFPLASYTDLGTWASIFDFVERHGSMAA